MNSNQNYSSKTPLSVEEAQSHLLEIASALSMQKLPQTLSLAQCLHHYLAEDLLARRDQPGADNAAMDGYAVRFADLPGPLKLSGEVAAGYAPTQAIARGQAMRIFTGAILPQGADTILIQEDATVQADQVLMTGSGPRQVGTHIRRRASDFAQSSTLLTKGARLTAGAIATAAMAGYGALAVGQTPRVAIISTGDELVPPGSPTPLGRIPESNGTMIAALLADIPCVVTPPIIIRDNRAALRDRLGELTHDHDVIVTSGGASVGDHDHVRGALDDAGAEQQFWRVAMRPGKPLIASKLGDTIILGLPGNPSSSFVTAILFLKPVLARFAGSCAPLPLIHTAALETDLAEGKERREYLRARWQDGKLTVFSKQDSAITHMLALTNALVIRERRAAPAKLGSPAQFIAV